MNSKTKKITTIGMLCAIAYAVMAVGRFPVVLFLKYDPKDVIIAIGGFLFGPMTAFAISLITSLLEMVTLSDTGPIGCLMNVLSSCAFACTAAWIYKRRRTLRGAVTGLAAGSVLMVLVMLLWNYLITPLYMGVERSQVAALLLPAFLPFNLVKSALNAAFTMLLYKPVAKALQRTGLTERPSAQAASSKGRLGAMLVSALLVVTGVLVILVFQGVL